MCSLNPSPHKQSLVAGRIKGSIIKQPTLIIKLLPKLSTTHYGPRSLNPQARHRAPSHRCRPFPHRYMLFRYCPLHPPRRANLPRRHPVHPWPSTRNPLLDHAAIPLAAKNPIRLKPSQQDLERTSLRLRSSNRRTLHSLVPELLTLYPNALVICTVRDPDAWVKGMATIANASTL
jgi:hypothetical protein